jgi:hypothetical protein
VCEEFHCLPREAEQALAEDMNGMLFQIFNLRSLADAKQRIDHAPQGEVPTDAAAQRFLRLQMEAVGEELGISTS